MWRSKTNANRNKEMKYKLKFNTPDYSGNSYWWESSHWFFTSKQKAKEYALRILAPEMTPPSKHYRIYPQKQNGKVT